MCKRVLIVGLCCLDVVSYLDNFPVEDSDNRVFDSRICLGGNATNSTLVFNQLSSKCNDINCELFAALPNNNKLVDELIEKSGINIGKSVRRVNSECPLSTVIINSKNNGSRTILHYRGNLEEITFEEFYNAFGQEIKDGKLDWIHFEGRNFNQVKKMMEFTKNERLKNRPFISVELEKVRPFPCLEQLIEPSDLIFVSKDFAQFKGWNDMEAAINGIQQEMGESSKIVFCAWGEKGAAVRESFTNKSSINKPPPKLYIQQIFPLLPSIIDTLGLVIVL
uniref:Carbohydrate kinase PfkB domain-containing protein n=1 Tax=Meloidogyne enterolobii TaxID=390850 RepID=A0A6V7VII4_MELEN|nr:unnamed protein product [Meloidogyne enterolobii]